MWPLYRALLCNRIISIAALQTGLRDFHLGTLIRLSLNTDDHVCDPTAAVPKSKGDRQSRYIFNGEGLRVQNGSAADIARGGVIAVESFAPSITAPRVFSHSSGDGNSNRTRRTPTRDGPRNSMKATGARCISRRNPFEGIGGEIGKGRASCIFPQEQWLMDSVREK